MDAKIHVATAYRAYRNILAAGEPHDGGRRFEGLSAYTDHDGYGVTLSDDYVSARLSFHNKIRIDAPSSQALRRFVKRLNEVAARETNQKLDEATLREHSFDA